jgi:integrase
MRLTRQTIARLSITRGKTELIVFDENLPGFGIRLRAGGKRVWIAQYRFGPTQRRVTLGSVETLDPDEARKQARSVLAKAQLGGDPQADKAEARARAGLTLQAVALRYLEFHAARRLKPRSLLEVTRHLNVHWSPLHRLSVHEIQRREVASRLLGIASENGPIAANRARAALSAFFAWAMREGIAETNPVIGTNLPTPERSRDRVLSDKELTVVWNASRDDDYGRIVQLLMLTGQRRAEVGGMQWGELALETGHWRIPAERTKNHRPHEVPLSAAVLGIIEAIPRRERVMVFGEGDGPFQGWSRAKAALDARIGIAGQQMAPWRLHDLRRTVATRMGDLGIEPHSVEAVLNHVSGIRTGIAGVYNRSAYATEKRTALALWAEHITALVAGRPTRVVHFRREA